MAEQMSVVEKDSGTSTIAQDIGKSFVALNAVIVDNVLREVTPELDKVDLRLNAIEQKGLQTSDEYKNSILQFKQDVAIIKEEAVKHMEQNDNRLTEFAKSLQEVCKSILVKG